MITMAGHQPETLHFTRSVLATPASVGVLRDLAEVFLRKWGYEHKTDEVLLVVSELATNSVKAVRGTVIALDVHVLPDRSYLMVELWDQSPHRPQPRDAGPDDESGRGLAIVGMCAAQWGVRIPPYGGKVIWAAISTAAD